MKENTGPTLPVFNVENAVRERYSKGAARQVPELCCPVDYNPEYLKAIPQEVLDRDYGCGDPSKQLQKGEVVLDLGSGTGKICFIASQVVGPEGKVLGVDMNDDMLSVARRHAPAVARNIGYSNVEFLKGKIQDLALNLDELENHLKNEPVATSTDYLQLEEKIEGLRAQSPMIASDSVDVVVSNCVLNLVRAADKQKLFQEIFCVLKRGGRAVISDITSDEAVPERLQQDAELWSGCISGAFREDEFLAAFEAAGFHGVRVLERGDEPWTTVDGIEFRSMTVEAYKGKQGPCLDANQAVIYRGPWKKVFDDDGHVLRRGERMAVCDKTYRLYQKPPYAGDIIPVPPRVTIPLADVAPFDCRRNEVRHPRETKGEDYRDTKQGQNDCDSGTCC